MMLAIVLLSLMATTVAVGMTSTLALRDQFDNTIKTDMPRLQDLLHLDRDLFRAERSLEMSLFDAEQAQRTEMIAEFDRQVDRTANWWDQYLTTSSGLDSELAWQSDYVDQRAAWLSSSQSLAGLVKRGLNHDNAMVKSQLAATQSAFVAMRGTVDNIEEQVAEPLIETATSDLRHSSTVTVITMLLLLLLGLAAGGITSVSTYRAARRQHLATRRRDRERIENSARAEFEAQLNQALDMAQTEEGAFQTISLVLEKENADRPTELLLADSSQAHLRQVVSTDGTHRGPGCPALSPGDCPAIRRGTTLSFLDGHAYSVCPHLRDRGGEPCSAVCVPVSVAGRTVGVLHTTGPNMEPADPLVVSRIEEVATRSGDRIGVLRAFAKSQTQASTDPLTGLANRRSFENEISTMLKQDRRLAIAYGDLDYFKKLNDTYGHDAGDRALRLFSRVVRDSLRDIDMAARWGGEEFVIMFADADASSAAAALDRLRQNLSMTLASGTTPPFTVSFGLTDTSCSTNLEDLVNLADEALLNAKSNGRDRVVIAGRSSSQSPGDAEVETQPNDESVDTQEDVRS